MFVIRILQVSTVLLIQGGGVLGSLAQDQLRQRLLAGYNSNAHPHNDVRLLFTVVYMACPIPDPDTGILVSRIHETQVSL